MAMKVKHLMLKGRVTCECCINADNTVVVDDNSMAKSY